MENIKKSIQSFYEGDKAIFILVCTRVLLGVLFFISLYMPFIFDSTVIGGKVSLSGFPGSIIYELILFVSIPLYFYFILVNNNSLAKKTMLIQIIIVTLAHLYGVLVYRVGFPSTATGGFAKGFEFILLILMWFIYIKRNLTLNLINKYILKEKTD